MESKPTQIPTELSDDEKDIEAEGRSDDGKDGDTGGRSDDGKDGVADGHSDDEKDVEAQDAPVPAPGAEMTALERVETTEYPSNKNLALIMACLYLSTFLFALDRTIIGTAIPQITDEFHSFDDVGAFLLTFCAFQLFFGRVYTFYSAKWVYISLIGVFEVGSIVCAAAPNSIAFIFGRAIAGLGSAGMINGAIIILISSAPLHKRPMLMGFFGAVFGCASAAGPLLGGVFTTDVTWRWCFWINVPLGGVAALALTFILKSPPPVKRGTPIKEQIHQLDPFGTAVLIPAIVCLLLALQWGGSTYPWSNARVIALLVVAGVLFIVFGGIQIWKGEYATIPLKIIKQRTIAAGFCYVFLLSSTMMIGVYYIPIYFQAIQGVSAVESGIRNLPLLLSLVTASILGGIFTSRVGYYTPLIIASSVIMPIGAGLITTWNTTTDHQKWIGYQVILGFGIGIGMQQPSVAAQTVLSKRDVSTGTALMFFAQSLGGSIFISVAQNVLSNRIISELQGVPGFSAKRIASIGATELRKFVQPKYLSTVLDAYSDALRDCFYVATALASVTIFAAVAIEWKSVKAKKTN